MNCKLTMMQKTYFVLIIISLLCIASLGYFRFNTEAQLKYVDFILDYEELVDLANQSEHDVMWWLNQFHSVGFNKVALKERTFENLINEGAAIKTMMRNEFIQNRDIYSGRLYSKKTVDIIANGDKFDYIVVFDDDILYDAIKSELSKKYPKDFVHFADESHIMVFDGKAKEALYLDDGLLKDEEGKNKRSMKVLTDSKISWLGLGFNADDVRLIKNADMKPFLRPINFPRFSDKLLQNFKADYQMLDAKPEYVIFQGDSVLGYDLTEDDPEHTFRFLDDENIAIGLIESGVQRGHSKQAGINELAKMLNYKAVRVFPIVGYIQKRYQWYGYKGAEEVENTLYRAITERNIRSIYFRPFREKDNDVVYITDWKPYDDMFKRLEKRLSKHHILIGKESYMPINIPHPLLIVGASLSLIVIGLYLITRYLVISIRYQWILLCISVLGSLSFSYIVPNIWQIVLSILTAVLIPSFGGFIICYMINHDLPLSNLSTKLKLHPLLYYAGLIGMMIIGGIGLGGILSHSAYLIEIEYYRGVKISQLLPLLIFSIMFVLEMHDKINMHNNRSGDIENTVINVKYKRWTNLFNMLFSNVKVFHVLMIGIFGAVGVIYMARTGHETSIEPSNIEMIFRNLLEMKFIARPRTKEIFIAFPALYILFTRLYKGKKGGEFILGLLSMLGLTSVLNTFSHLRTPLYISIFRTIYSMVLGIIIGYVMLVCMNIIVSAFTRYHQYIKEAKDE